MNTIFRTRVRVKRWHETDSASRIPYDKNEYIVAGLYFGFLAALVALAVYLWFTGYPNN